MRRLLLFPIFFLSLCAFAGALEVAASPIYAALPNLSTRLSSYDQAAQPALPVVCFGSSLGNLKDGSGQTACDVVTKSLSGLLNSGTAPSYTFKADNESVGGSGAADFNQAWAVMQSKGVSPAVCVFVYGMNDGQATSFNAGETFSGFVTNMTAAIPRCAASGADSIIITSPDGRAVTSANAPLQTALPSDFAQTYPGAVSAPVGCAQFFPTCSNAVANILNTALPALYASARLQQVNDIMRQVAANTGSLLIDSEFASYQVLLAGLKNASTQSQLEDSLYEDNLVHPNAKGIQQFFSDPIANAFSRVASGSGTSTTLNGASIYTPAGIENPGALSGSGSVIQNGPGVLFLLSPSTYSGGTTVAGGAIYFMEDNGLGASSGQLRLSGGAAISGGVNTVVSRPVIIDSAGGAIGVAFGGFRLNVTSPITGTGALSKTGPGTLVLSANNTYSGGTKVLGGVLQVDGTIRGQTTVASGGTLGGIGTVNSTLVLAGGKLTGGDGASGTLNINGDLVLNSGSIYSISGSFTSVVNVTGTATIDGTIDINSTPVLGQKRLILTAAGGIKGGFSAQTSSGVIASLEYTATQVFATLRLRTIDLAAGPPEANWRNLTLVLNDAIANGASQILAPVSIQTGKPLAVTLSQLSGQPTLGAAESSFLVGRQFLDLLAVHGRSLSQPAPVQSGFQSPLGLEARIRHIDEAVRAKESPDKLAFWLEGYGGHIEDRGQAEKFGSENAAYDSEAVAAGADLHLGSRLSVGFAAGWGRTFWGMNNGLGGGKARIVQAGVNAALEGSRAYLVATAGYTISDARIARQVSLGSGSQFGGDFRGRLISGSLEFGHKIHTRSGFTLTPYVNVTLQSFSAPDYAETTLQGDNTFALHYGAANGKDIAQELGAEISRKGRNGLGFRMRAGWVHQYAGPPSDIAHFTAFTASPFRAFGTYRPLDMARVSMFSQQEITNSLNLYESVHSEFFGAPPSLTGSLGLSYRL